MWKKHRKEIILCIIVPIIVVLLLLAVVTIFEKLNIHVSGSREMWIGLIGAVLGGMFTLIGVMITIYKQDEVEEERKRLENMPILKFETGYDTVDVDATLECYQKELITSGFIFLEEKDCANIRISVANNQSVFNFTIDGCLIDGKEVVQGDAFAPAKRRLVCGESINMVFNCEVTERNVFCLIRFSFEDIFGNKYYQELPFIYSEALNLTKNISKPRQVIDIRDIKQQVLVSKTNKNLEEAAKDYIDYEVFCKG